MKLKTITLLSLLALFAQSVSADPEERAQMCKALILQAFVGDGWQLVQETHSMLVVERPMTGWGGFLTQALTTGANGTNPVVRWSVTVVPVSDHWTKCPAYPTINSQNAFGQSRIIPITNKKTTAYIFSVLKRASAGMPAKYKAIKPSP